MCVAFVPAGACDGMRTPLVTARCIQHANPAATLSFTRVCWYGSCCTVNQIVRDSSPYAKLFALFQCWSDMQLSRTSSARFTLRPTAIVEGQTTASSGGAESLLTRLQAARELHSKATRACIHTELC